MNLSSITNANWAVDGISLLIIYKDPNATYQGNIILADGNNTYGGGTFNYNLSYPAACAVGTNAQAFVLVSDMQNNVGSTFPAIVNNTSATYPKTFYDIYTSATNVNAGQSSGNYNVSDNSDCFTVGMLGLYYQTTGCVVCTPPPSLTLTANTQSATCNNCNGTATVNVTGGSSPYSYTWTPSGGNSSNATNLCVGSYTVTAKDASGCNTGTIALNISQAPSYTVTLSSTSVTCNGLCNGSATANVTGAMAPVTYTWLPSGGNSNTAASLCSGNYSVTVKDGTGCQNTLALSIAQPMPLSISAVNITSLTCNNSNDGSASLTLTGGTPPYSYTWTPSVSTGPSATNLSAGTYTINIKDNNNCTTFTVITISQPSALSLTATQTQSVSCNGGNNGSANASVSGGVGGYTYTWSPSGGNSATAGGLTAGIYTINVKDANNCAISGTVQIQQPLALSLTAAQTQSVTCNGGTDGIASSTLTGGVGGYTYTWSPSGGNAAVANNLTAGVYTINVKDANSCMINTTVQINQPPALSIAITTQSASCSVPGSATAIVSGGVGGYTYTWTPTGGNANIATGLNAGNYAVNVKDANGCIISGTLNIPGPSIPYISSINTSSVTCYGMNNGSISVGVMGGTTPYTYSWSPSVSTNSFALNLSASVYSVSVIDNNGCITSTNVTISQPPALSITVTQTQSVSCNGGNNGSANASVSGGVGGYTYTWSPSGGNTAAATNLSAGIYTVDIKDANNCAINGTVQIFQPPALSLTATQTQSVSCNGGNNGIANVAVSGGVGGYTYTWSPSGGNAANAGNLTAGIYTINVKDLNNCSISSTIQISQPPALSITAIQTQSVSCNGGNNGIASSTVSGGMGNYTYTWFPMGGNASVASNLMAGIYTVSVNDINGCNISAVVNISQPLPIILTASPNSTICFGSSTYLNANANGGNTPYIYSWSPNIGSGAGPILVSPTLTSQYQVSVQDANGCPGPSSIITVYVTPPLSATGFTTQVCDGKSVMLYPTITSPGNGGPFVYTWNNGSSSPSITVTGNSLLGNMNTYSVIIDDGCTYPPAIANFTVNIYPNPVISFSADITKGCVPLQVNYTPSTNSVSGSSYTWIFDNGLSVSNSGGISSTTYSTVGLFSPTLIAQSQYGCITQTVMTHYIQTYGYPIADFTVDSWTISLYEPTVNFINLSQGGNSYLWNFGDPSSADLNNSNIVNPSHDYMYSGTYPVNLIVTNEHGCSSTITKYIYVEAEYNIYIPNAFTPDGNGLNDVFQPKGIGIDESDYLMLIFDRWGELIFESNNFKVGWDGSVKGTLKKAKEDVYVYKIYVMDIKGNKHEYVGHVTCLPYTSNN